ncbi:ZIP family metal transporter [Planctomicrobium sp. SH668]|uniref:ZIP family metal transporter n=1 Tax=Planctomicrobium sp. SH668 TaxID=3448126 RepID=UPI003F5CAEDA
MSSTYLTLAVYCFLIVVASLIGGRLPQIIKLTHKRMQVLISFVGGLMLGIALFHLLPHAISYLGSNQLDRAMLCMMLGLVVMFFLLRTFHFHHHDPEQLPAVQHDHDHDHDHAGHHHHEHAHSKKGTVPGELGWLGVFIGLSVHTLIDGLALGASLEAESMHTTGGWIMGLGTFLAIVLHKPLDALSITALMRASNWPAYWQTIVNATFAIMCPLGAALFLVSAGWLVDQQAILVGSMLAFSAGVFLCISLSDLLPEMEFHSHHRIPLSISLLLGIALAWGIGFLEPEATHAPRELRDPIEFDFQHLKSDSSSAVPQQLPTE